MVAYVQGNVDVGFDPSDVVPDKGEKVTHPVTGAAVPVVVDDGLDWNTIVPAPVLNWSTVTVQNTHPPVELPLATCGTLLSGDPGTADVNVKFNKQSGLVRVWVWAQKLECQIFFTEALKPEL